MIAYEQFFKIINTCFVTCLLWIMQYFVLWMLLFYVIKIQLNEVICRRYQNRVLNNMYT